MDQFTYWQILFLGKKIATKLRRTGSKLTKVFQFVFLIMISDIMRWFEIIKYKRRYVAMVLDRLFLWIFTIAVIGELQSIMFLNINDWSNANIWTVLRIFGIFLKLSSISPHNTWIAHCRPNIPNLLLKDQCQFWTIQLSGKISPEYSEIFGRNIFPAN